MQGESGKKKKVREGKKVTEEAEGEMRSSQCGAFGGQLSDLPRRRHAGGHVRTAGCLLSSDFNRSPCTDITYIICLTPSIIIRMNTRVGIFQAWANFLTHGLKFNREIRRRVHVN